MMDDGQVKEHQAQGGEGPHHVLAPPELRCMKKKKIFIKGLET
jgi:hypothetical protein